MKMKIHSLTKWVLVTLGILMISTIIMPGQIHVHAATEKTDKATGLSYNTAGVITRYEGNATNLSIPTKLGNVSIKEIGPAAFSDNTKLKSVTFPEGLTLIGDNSFKGCTALTTVKLPKTLKTIDISAFDNCRKLTDVTIPSGVTSIKDSAFCDCKAITEIKLPAGITTLGSGAFSNTSITEISIPSKLTAIEISVFSGTKISSVEIPNNIKSIGSYAFSGCKQLKTAYVPKSVKAVGIYAFDSPTDNTSLTVYGYNDTATQLYCADYNIKFIDQAADTSSKPVVGSDAIVIPADTKSETVTAKPAKTKLSVNGKAKTLEAYTIDGEDYYRLSDLATILKGTDKNFCTYYFDDVDVTYIAPDEDSNTTLKKGDGNQKNATRVYPSLYFEDIDISNAITVYSINGENFYNFFGSMNIINCGVFKDKKTGDLNLKPKFSYEPLDSPVFSAVPKGNAAYQTVQQGLYDAYLSGKDYYTYYHALTVPDNTTLYVPRGISYSSIKIYLGKNSAFTVKGGWGVEYPDQELFAKSSATKNAYYTFCYTPCEPVDDTVASNNVVSVSTADNFKWTDLPLTSATLSYDNISNGVQTIRLNVTREKSNPESCVFVYFHVKGGESYGHFYENVKSSIDLTPQMATIVGQNIGKNATVDRLEVQCSNGVSFSDPITLDVNWTITTTGDAPDELQTVNYTSPDNDSNSLNFAGLTKNSYIAKYILQKGVTYSTISPDNNFTVAPYNETKSGDRDSKIMGKEANIALFTGVKKSSGKNAYAFVVSPLSDDLSYVLDDPIYPKSATFSIEDKRSYLDVTLAKLEAQYGIAGSTLMVKYHKKGDPADVLDTLYTGTIYCDSKTLSGQIELTPAFSDLYAEKGSINIDKLYVYTYSSREVDDYKWLSIKFTSVSCDYTTFAVSSAKLGKDTTAYITADSLLINSTKTSLTAPFDIMNFMGDITSLQISPAGKKSWGKNMLTEDGMYDGDIITVNLTINPSAPRYDFKVVYTSGKSYILKGADFAGITKEGGTVTLQYYETFDDNIACVTNNAGDPTIKEGAYGTDTIDVVLLPGSEDSNFDVTDFSLGYNDDQYSPVWNGYIEITGLSKSADGSAKLTIKRYFINESEILPSKEELVLLYKGFKVGIIWVKNY